MGCEISIVIPVFNEVGNIIPLAREVALALANDGRSYELIFVDDASADGTWQRIHECARENPRVRGLRHARNVGQSAALWTGFRAATGAVLATMDGDRQNDPADLPRLLAAVATCDFVCGVRMRRKDSWLRRISSRLARVARRWVLGVDFVDTGCALRVFKRAVLGEIPGFNGVHRFLPILVQGAGFSTQEIPVGHRPRVSGTSKYGVRNRLWRGVLDLLAMAWYQRRRLPVVPLIEAVPGRIPAGSAPDRSRRPEPAVETYSRS